MVRAIKFNPKPHRPSFLHLYIVQNPLFKFHAVILIVSVASSLTVLFLKTNPGSALYYADAAIMVTAQALLVGAWYGRG